MRNGMTSIIKRCLGFLLAVILFILSAKMLRFLLVDDTKSYTRIMLHQMYESEENIDVLFLGSSHVYRSIIPEIIDDKLNVYSFNAGSSAQKMDASYFLLKEAAKYNKLNTVYLELYFGVAEKNKRNERTQMTSTYIISDYAKPSMDKLSFLISATPKDDMVNSFILARRNWYKIFDLSYITELISNKNKDSYKNYIWERDNADEEYYVDRGFVANDGVTGDVSEWAEKVYEKVNVNGLDAEDNDWRQDIKAIAEYCKKNDITLCLYVAPVPYENLKLRGNYQDYHNIIEGIAGENGLSLYDFCYVKPEYFDTTDLSLYRDEGHLNTKGAEKFSNFFGDFVGGKYDNEEVFYPSFEVMSVSKHNE